VELVPADDQSLSRLCVRHSSSFAEVFAATGFGTVQIKGSAPSPVAQLAQQKRTRI
jgi:hypothetical protein